MTGHDIIHNINRAIRDLPAAPPTTLYVSAIDYGGLTGPLSVEAVDKLEGMGVVVRPIRDIPAGTAYRSNTPTTPIAYRRDAFQVTPSVAVRRRLLTDYVTAI